MVETRSVRPADPDALFARFREHGDPAALAALFDATADGLHRLALTLLPDPASAEDAVQETFLAALEHADRHDGARPVVPWLVGILRHKAEDLRRRSRRPDPWRLPVPDPEEGAPGTEAERREREARVRAALEALPEPLRLPSLLRWKHGLEPAEIAHLLGRRPGAVRMALSRALERLRRRLGGLPAALLAGGERAPRGLPAVREAVAARAAEAAVAAGAGAAIAAGGILVGKKIAVAAAALLLLGGAAWWWGRGEGGGAVPARGPRVEPATLVAFTTAPPAAAAPVAAEAPPPSAPAAPTPPAAVRGDRTVRWPVVAGECPVPAEGTVIPLRARPGANDAERDPPPGRMVGGELVVEGLPAEGWWGAEALGPEGGIASLFVPTGETAGRETTFRKGRQVEVLLREEDGTAVAGARVEARNSGNNPLGAPGVTDAGGRVVLEGLPLGRAIVLLVAGEPGQVPLELGTVDLEPGNGRLEVVLRPPVPLDVRVTVDGKPGLPEGLTLAVQGALPLGRTDDADASTVRFLLRPASKEPVVRVYGGGKGLQPANAASTADGSGRLTVDLDLHRVGAGGALVLKVIEPPDGRFQWELRRIDGPGGPRVLFGSAWRTFDTGQPEGTWENKRFPGLPAGRYEFRTDCGLGTGEFTIAGEGDEFRATLDLSKSRRVTGRVEGPASSDLRRASVLVEGEGLGGQAQGGILMGGRVPGAPVGPDGTFSVRIPGDRPVRLRAWHPSLVPDPAGGTVEVQEAADGLVLRLVEGPHALFTLDPVRRDDIYRTQTEVRLFRGEPAGEPLSTQVAEEVDGRFRIGGFPPEVLTLWIDAPGSAPKVLRGVRLFGGANDLGVLPMEEGATVRIDLTLGPGAAPPNLFVLAMSEDGPPHSRGLNYYGKGEVLLRGLGPGRYRVTVHPGGAPGTVLLTEHVQSEGSGVIPLALDLR